MKTAVLYGKPSLENDPSVRRLVDSLQNMGHEVFPAGSGDISGAEILLSVGGDGTFLRAGALASPKGIPVMGVNLGRLGFLSENTPEMVLDAFRSGDYAIERRDMLQVSAAGRNYLAINEVALSRTGSAMLGVEVSVDGVRLPVIWGDGLLVSTSSGSTAYSLSVGGPIVTPSSKVLVVAPISPHNLNVRPLVIPVTSRIDISFLSRDANVNLSVDNNSLAIPSDTVVSAALAQFSLKRVTLGNSSFIKALSEKLHWGEDNRNER